MNFDPLQSAQRLEEAGLERAQAEAIATAIWQSKQSQHDDIVLRSLFARQLFDLMFLLSSLLFLEAVVLVLIGKK